MRLTDAQPHQRRLVLVMETDDRFALQDTPEAEILSDAEIKVLELPGPGQDVDDDLAASLIASGLATRGSVLLQSPFSTDQYYPADDAADRILLEKFVLSSTVAQLLGATSVEIVELDELDVVALRELGGGVSVPAIEAGVAGDTRTSEHLARRLSLIQEFAGHTPDIDAAQNYLVNHRLTHEEALRQLIVQRTLANVLVSHSLSFTTEREAAAAKRLVGRLAGLSLPAGLSLGISEEESHYASHSLTMNIEFGLRPPEPSNSAG